MPQHAGDSGYVFMVLDVIEDTGGRYQVWGKTDEGHSIVVRVTDFQPYFYMATPTHQASLTHVTAVQLTDHEHILSGFPVKTQFLM